MSRRLSAPLLALSCLVVGPLCAAPQAPDPAVDAIFSAYDRTDSPGCALGVIRDGDFVYRRGYGMANLEYDLPLGAQSIFRIGSTSKQFTATAIALLAEDGKISLDDPVRRYFPEFPAWADAMTIRQLVHHTSGMRDYLELAFLAGKADDADYYTDQWVLDLLARQRETNFPAGTQYLYSNSGYLLLAHIVERVTGQTLRQYAEEHIFGPLGMRHTHFHDDHNEIVPRRATGYAPAEAGGYRISVTTLDIVGDGSVFTTIDDLLLWDRNFYDNRLGKGGPGLITTLTTSGALNSGESLDYAFGLAIEDFHGSPMISHGGAFVGYRAEMVRLPQQRLSAAVLCNRSDAAPDQLARKVVMHYLGLDSTVAGTDAARIEAAETIAVSEEALQEFVGDFWEDAEAFAAETAVEAGKLWAVHSPTRRSELVPVGPDRFQMIGVPAEVYVTFERDEHGITGMRRTINGQPRGQFRPFARRRATAAGLAGYSGSYYSPELEISYRLYLSGDRLMFKIPYVAEQELTPMFEETFENPDYGSFTFERAGDGPATGFKLQSGRVKNLAFSRQ
jgi:CubicO group peptidase (beta-lactamase class C family)